MANRREQLIVLAIAMLLVSNIASAQNKQFKFEITAIAAYRVGGNFEEIDSDSRVDLNDSVAQGITLNIKANPQGQYELLYTRQNTDADTSGFLANDPTIDLDVEHFHFGGTYLFDGQSTRPFIALTVGLSHFDPLLPDSGSENFFSASFGGGIQLNADKRIGVRLEARMFTTFVNDNSKIFCGSDGVGSVCLIQVDGRLLTQWEARAGLVFRF